jgi:hypothetical protein
VDFLLAEFRQEWWDEQGNPCIELLPFASREGQELIAALVAQFVDLLQALGSAPAGS